MYLKTFHRGSQAPSVKLLETSRDDLELEPIEIITDILSF